MNDDLQFDLQRMTLSDLDFIMKYSLRKNTQYTSFGKTNEEKHLNELAAKYYQLYLEASMEIDERMAGLVDQVKEQFV